MPKPAATAPRALAGEQRTARSVPVGQEQDRLHCASAWSPASPTFAASDLPSTPISDAVGEAAALGQRTMHHSIENSSANHSHRNTSTSAKSDMHADDPIAMADLDREMMSMLVNLNAGPSRSSEANWGFEFTPAETQALYDPLLVGATNQPVALSRSMMLMPSSSAEMAHLMGMATSEQGFVGGGHMTGFSNNTTVQPPAVDPFYSGFVMPYQDCTTLPVGDFPLYDGGGMCKPTFGAAGMNQFTPAGSHSVVDNHLEEVPVTPYFGDNGAAQSTAGVGATFQGAMGNTNVTTLFNEMAQPPAAAIDVGFEVPDLADDDSDWNGSSSGFSGSSSPIANNTLPVPLVSVETAQVAPSRAFKSSRTPKDGTKKPKRIRRLCSVAGCGKRARSQDLCIAHGGGRRCIVEGCEKSSQGGNMCIKHGGGKRCKHPGCDKAAQTNALCKAHGGGPRCQAPGCTKSSQGGGFCRAHGGGKRCAAEGCNKGTQRGDFCALHGGSRVCEVRGCMRNDRGGGFCAHHGGGKRCSIANCDRSCRRNGLCSTHLRLLGHEASVKVSDIAPAAISAAMTSSSGVTSV